jgi:hypothetical protein
MSRGNFTHSQLTIDICSCMQSLAFPRLYSEACASPKSTVFLGVIHVRDKVLHQLKLGWLWPLYSFQHGFREVTTHMSFIE